MSNSKNKLLIIFSSILISSCGGGGGGGGEPAAPPPPPPSPTATISIEPSSAYVYEAVSVTWSSTNTSACTASGDWSGAKSTSGTESISFETIGEKTLTVECTGSGGSASASATVSISYKPLDTGRYTRIDGRDIFVDKGTNNLFHLGLNPRYLTKKHSGYTYGTGAVFGPGFWGDGLLSCSSADLNGDEYPDAIMGTALMFSGGDDATQYDVNNPEIRERVHFLINNGDGSFSDGTDLLTGTDFHRITAYKEIHVGDLNGDGLDDIATESASAGGIVRGEGILLLVSQPDGTYKDETSKIEFDRIDVPRDGYVQENVLGANGGSIFFFDLNGDGYKDLFNTYSTTGNGGMPKVFLSQEEVLDAFKNGDLNSDLFIVLLGQSPEVNGMPELHKLTSPINALQKKGYKIALVTDGRMSGASGSFPALIHAVSKNENLYKIQNNDQLTLDLKNALFLIEDFNSTEREPIKIEKDNNGLGRSLFELFRNNVSSVNSGASIFNK